MAIGRMGMYEHLWMIDQCIQKTSDCSFLLKMITAWDCTYRHLLRLATPPLHAIHNNCAEVPGCCRAVRVGTSHLTATVIHIFVFFHTGFLYRPGCPGTHSVDQTGLKLRNPPASASQVLGLKACATTPGCNCSTHVTVCVLSLFPHGP
jgi:hypothetical protein